MAKAAVTTVLPFPDRSFVIFMAISSKLPAQILSRGGVVWVQAQRLLELLPGRPPLARVQQRHAQRQIRPGGIGLRSLRFLQGGCRRAILSFRPAIIVIIN